jgi:hypothetical protein
MAQALFANQRETNLQSTVALIEEVLASLGYGPPEQARTAPGEVASGPAPVRAWRITKGSAVGHVRLLERPEFTHLRVSAQVMTLAPAVDRAALFAHLLELNHGLCGAAFALDGEVVTLVSERSTLDLDRSEIAELIRRVTTYADDHDDALVARFGGTRGGPAT